MILIKNKIMDNVKILVGKSIINGFLIIKIKSVKIIFLSNVKKCHKKKSKYTWESYSNAKGLMNYNLLFI